VNAAELSLTQTTATIAESESPSSATIAQDEAAVTRHRRRSSLPRSTHPDHAEGPFRRDRHRGERLGRRYRRRLCHVVGPEQYGRDRPGGRWRRGGHHGTSATSSSSSAFITIDSLAKLQVVSGFAEADATKLAVSDPATVTFSALPNVQVAGRVVAVSPTSTVVNNVVTYGHDDLARQSSRLREGRHDCERQRRRQSRSNVLELPSAAISTTGAASSVELLRNGTNDDHADPGRSRRQLVDPDRRRSSQRRRRRHTDGERRRRDPLSTGTGTGAGPGAGLGGGGLGGGGFGGGLGGGARPGATG